MKENRMSENYKIVDRPTTIWRLAVDNDKIKQAEFPVFKQNQLEGKFEAEFEPEGQLDVEPDHTGTKSTDSDITDGVTGTLVKCYTSAQGLAGSYLFNVDD